MLEIPKHIAEEMKAHAEKEAPVEACGILAGKGGRVEKYYPMVNADASSDHFMMEPEEQFSVIKDIRAEAMEMLAIAHSHPCTPARPSEEDIRLALTPGAVYVIISLQDKKKPDIKGFRIEEGRVSSVGLAINSR